MAVRPDDDSRIVEAAGNSNALIRRPIVTKKEFPVLEGLKLDRPNGLSQRSFIVPKRHCDAYKRWMHFIPRWLCRRNSLTDSGCWRQFPEKVVRTDAPKDARRASDRGTCEQCAPAQAHSASKNGP